MSYCRFGWNNSDVYVFFSTDGTLECCGCILAKAWNYDGTEEMVEHLQEHIAAGHTVPYFVIPELIADHEENFPDAGPLPESILKLVEEQVVPPREERVAQMKHDLVNMAGMDEELAADWAENFTEAEEAK